MIRLVVVIFSVVLSLVGMGAELSREATTVYREKIEGLLTPLEEVVGRVDQHASGGHEGSVLLYETVCHVEPDGRRIRATHLICKAYTDAGAKDIESDTYGYSADLTIPHLVLARTRNKEGRVVDVGGAEAFVQRAGGDGNSRLYNDQQEVVVVFPDAKVGSVTEAILVREDKEPRFEREYSSVLWWTAGWPIGERRFVVDLSEEMGKRMGELVVGELKGRRTELAADEGRVRIEWKAKNLLDSRSEAQRAPADQVGPVTYVSTWGDWGRFATWYGREVKGRDVPDDELKRLCDEWTDGRKTSEEILASLYEKVANEVRYTGLEFGRSALQPYDCNQVWKRRFGDCKDKANLLVTMLRHKGVDAWLGLVNTEHAGVVHKRSPSHVQFNHAIAVVDVGAEGEEKLVFCDPTIARGHPGMLAPSSADREVLMIGDGDARWAHSPEQRAGGIGYDFDLELGEDGRLFGWMTLKVTGYYSCGYVDAYSGVSRDQVMRNAAARVRPFFDGAEVVDVEVGEGDLEKGFTLRVFFTTPSGEADENGRFAIAFPFSRSLFYDFGDARKRETSFAMWQDETEVKLKVKMPEGSGVGSIPKPLVLETKGYRISAEWDHSNGNGGACGARLRIACLASLLLADEVSGPAQANRAFYHWAEMPLLVSRGGAGGGNEAARPVRQVEMPLMPTGSGQLDLVDRWYPVDDDRVKRETALREVIRFFPDDPDTVFQANLKLAYLKYYHDENEKALAAYGELAANRTKGVDMETHATARYMHAVLLEKTGNKEEAAGIVSGMANDGGLSDFRRGWSALRAGDWAAGEDSFSFYQLALSMDGGFKDAALTGYVDKLAVAGRAAEAGEVLVRHLSTDEARALGVVNQLMDRSGDREGGGIKRLAEVFAAARAALEAGDVRLVWLDDGGKRAEALAEQADVYPKLRERLAVLLNGYGGDLFERVELPAGLEKREDYEKRFDEVLNKENEEALAVARGYFLTFEPGDRFSEVLWRTLSLINWFEHRDSEIEPFFELLSGVCAGLPHSDGYYWECRFVEARWLEGRGRWNEAERIYAAMVGDSEMDPDFSHSAWHRRAITLEHLGRWDDAIECHLKFKDDRREYSSVCSHVLRGGLLQAASGREEEALETWSLLSDVPKSIYEGDGMDSEIEEALLLCGKREEAIAMWGRTRGWYDKSYVLFCRKSGMEGGGKTPPLALTADELTKLEASINSCEGPEAKELFGRESRRLFLQACYLPCHSLYVQSLVYGSSKKVLEKEWEGFRQCLVEYATAYDGGAGQPVGIDLMLRFKLGLLYDTGKFDQCLDGCREALASASLEKGREHFERVAWLYAIAATQTGTDMEQALASLKGLCNGRIEFASRRQCIDSVVALLRKMDRDREALGFLDAQLKREETAADAALGKALASSRDDLQRQLQAGDGFRAAVRDWLDRTKPVWFDEVDPESLGEKELKEFDDLVAGKEIDRTEIEKHKLRVLCAMSEKVEPVRAEGVLLSIVNDRAVWTNAQNEYASMMFGILDDSRVSNSLRAQFAWTLGLELALMGEEEMLERLARHEAWKFLRERLASRGLDELRITAKAVGGCEPMEIRQTLLKLAEGQAIDQSSLFIIRRLYTNLLQLGEVELLKEIRSACRKWEFDPATGVKPLALRLEWSRLARQAGKATGFHDLMMAEFGPSIERHAEQAPENWKERIDFQNLDDLSEKQAGAFHAARLASGHLGAWVDERAWINEPWIWLEDGEGKPRADRMRKYVSLVMEEAPSDYVRMGCLLVVNRYRHDLDKETMHEVLKLVEPWMNPAKNPLCFTAARMLEAPDLFSGDSADPAGFETAIRNSNGYSALPVVMRIRILASREDPDGLEEFYDSTDVHDLLNSLVVIDAMKAAKRLGLEDELEMLAEYAEEEIHRLVHASWMKPDSFSADQACRIAIAFGLQDLLPEAWGRDVSAGFKDSEDCLHQFMTLWSVATEDWATVEEYARKGLEGRPHDREYEAWLGRALLGLGRKQEALPYLEEAVRVHPMRSELLVDFDALIEEARKE